jgi:radical SAM enzyme (TIGR01210 family)
MNVNVSPLDTLEKNQTKPVRPTLRDTGLDFTDTGFDALRAAFVTTNQLRHTHDGEPVNRVMAVLRTVGCAWDDGVSGCTMCDFKRYAVEGVGVEQLTRQLEAVVRDFPANVEHFELLTLGSFLHDQEVPPEFRRRAMDILAAQPTVKSVLVESRAEYVNIERLMELKGRLRPDQTLEMGLGVESRNSRLRNKVLKKGLSDRSVRRVMEVCKKAGVRFVSYLLVKPHTLDEKGGIIDAIDSGEWISSLAREIGVEYRIAYEPVFITHGTMLERMFKEGSYQILNLWSVVHLAKISAARRWPVFFGMSDENLSDERLPRSCPACNGRISAAIQKFNASGDASCFDGLSCECQADWRRTVGALPGEYQVDTSGNWAGVRGRMMIPLTEGIRNRGSYGGVSAEVLGRRGTGSKALGAG